MSDIKNTLSELHRAIRESNIQIVRNIILELKNELNNFEQMHREYLSILNKEKKLEKMLDKLMKEEEKITNYKVKKLKKFRKLPRL